MEEGEGEEERGIPHRIAACGRAAVAVDSASTARPCGRNWLGARTRVLREQELS